MQLRLLIPCLLAHVFSLSPDALGQKPLRIGIVGLTHAHVHWILGREDRGDIEIVGIAEPNTDLAKRFSEQHGYAMDIVYPTLEAMVDATHPEAVTAFNDIAHHVDVVRFCGPRGIHVMVEKPLAVSITDALEMESIATQYGVQLMTNYETTWYGSHAEAYRLIHEENAIGEIRKMIFYTGHPGPREIGCNAEFLEWLTDPVLNGAGALTDFGCYGADLATWFLQGAEPVAVSCITRQMKPDLYPLVDDDATIVIDYPETQVIILASWNWPHNRKETEIYGTHGYIKCLNATDMVVMRFGREGATSIQAEPLPDAVNDPFAYFAKVIHGHYPMAPWAPSSLEANIRVMRILQSAIDASQTSRR